MTPTDARDYQPSFDDFRALAATHDRVPIAATFVCDELTPVSAFARLSQKSDRAFLLESVVGGERVARYSFLSCDPASVFEAHGRRVRIFDGRSAGDRTLDAADPLAELESILHRHRRATLPGMPRFVGGAVGFASYDAVRYYERLPDAPPDDRGLPDLQFGLYEHMVIFDHARKVVMVVAYAHADGARPVTAAGTRTAAGDGARDDAALRTSYAAAVAAIDRIAAGLADETVRLPPVPVRLPADQTAAFRSNFERSAFENAVARSQEYVRAGDIFQVVLSQRFSADTVAAPFDVYRALRVVNPSPFMFFLKSPQVTLVGASPEIMCRVEDGVVTNRPLAGTRPRGKTDAEDRALRDELLADPKEIAEHVMLVDLGRNDVGRVAQPGTVRVEDPLSVEYYSHVMHLCSNVTGRLAPGKTALDALRAALPVGTVSGAPKVRAMQIIDQFEPTRRGPYAGAVGYLDFAGNMDTCIALRTIVMRPAVAGGSAQVPRFRADIQAGAGIVADSVPAREYDETLNKARGMLTAIAVAESRFAS